MTNQNKIPNGWHEVRLGYVLNMKHGKSQKLVESENGNYPILASGGCIGRASKFLYDKPSVLIGRKGTINKPQYMDKPFWTVDTLFYSEIKRNNDPKFIFYKFNMINWLRYNEGSTLPSLTASGVSSIKELFPQKIEEQEKIAEVLEVWDDAIENIQKQITNAQQTKKSLMQQLLTPKPHWQETKIKEIFEVTRGNVLAVNKMNIEQTNEYNYPVYSSQTKNNGIVGYYNSFLFDTCITWTTDGANAGDVKFRNGKFYCTNVCGVLKSNNGYANLCLAEIINQISHRYVSYVGNPKLMNNVMADIKVQIPPLPEQQHIAQVLTNADEVISNLENQLANVKEQKKALMQKLLTGDVRFEEFVS